jgi:hypothetical protein
LTAGFSYFGETEFGLALEKSEHMTVEVQDDDIIVTGGGLLCDLLQADKSASAHSSAAL